MTGLTGVWAGNPPRGRWRTLVGVCVVTCLLMQAQVGLSLAATLADAVPFSGSTLKGETLDFDPRKLERPALAVFWASWCRECRYEFHELKKLHAATLDRLDIYGVSVDKELTKAVDIARRAGLPYPSVFDPAARIAKLYEVRGTPTMVLIDRGGKVRHVGHRLDGRFHGILRQVLDGS